MKWSRAATIALLAMATASARAEPTQSDSLVLEEGELSVAIAGQGNLSQRARWLPISIAPDVYYGLARGFTIGWVHSTHALGLIRSDTGLCLREEEKGCPDRYSGTGIDVIAELYSGSGLWLAGRGRLYVERYTEPIKPRLAPGLVLAARRGRFSLLVDAHIAFGLYNLKRGNENTLHVPIWLGLHAFGPVSLYLRTGIDGGLHYFRDKMAIPLGAGISLDMSRKLRLSAQAVFPKLIGPLNSPRKRHLAVRFVTVFD